MHSMSRGLNKGEGGGISHALGLLFLVILLFLISGCGKTAEEKYMCSVVLEECEDIVPDRNSVDAGTGEDVTFVLTQKNGCIVSGTDYEDCTLAEMNGKTVLTLHNIQYPTVVKLETAY